MQLVDDIDRRLLRLLQDTPEMSMAQLAAESGLGAAACWRRVERLERSGVITGRRVVIDPRALGYEVEVSLRVTLDKTQANAFDAFLGAARALREVNEIQTFLGRVDVRLNIMARDMAHYQQIYRDKILSLPHIADIEALMLVANVKNGEALPI